jgi:tRNA G37 N-methylase TrmD
MDAMSNRTKQRRTGGLTLLLYQRTLHPELFKILASEKVSRRAYEADIWLVEGGHVIAFTAGKHTLTEVILTSGEPMTDRGLLQTIPCRGEKYHELTTAGNIRYMISTQEEQLTQTLYDATKHEIISYAAKRELMTADTPAAGETGASMSVLDIERRSHELLVQSFHLFDDNQMVIKTQAIIEVLKNV